MVCTCARVTQYRARGCTGIALLLTVCYDDGCDGGRQRCCIADDDTAGAPGIELAVGENDVGSSR